jgi:hypothetical protein
MGLDLHVFFKIHLALALPGAYAPTSMAFRITGAHKPDHDKAVVFEEGLFYY